MSPRPFLRLMCASAVLAGMLLPAASPADEICQQVYAACQRQAEKHERCAVEHEPAMVRSAVAIFEIESRLAASSGAALFGHDEKVEAQLRDILHGLRATADARLDEPLALERILIEDLHWRHAERLHARLEAPRDCSEAALERLARVCRAGDTEAKVLRRGVSRAAAGTCATSPPTPTGP